MSKRFEGEEPSYVDMLTAFRLFGMDSELGLAGQATAYASKTKPTDVLEFGVLPGSFSAREIEQLYVWAA